MFPAVSVIVLARYAGVCLLPRTVVCSGSEIQVSTCFPDDVGGGYGQRQIKPRLNLGTTVGDCMDRSQRQLVCGDRSRKNNRQQNRRPMDDQHKGEMLTQGRKFHHRYVWGHVFLGGGECRVLTNHWNDWNVGNIFMDSVSSGC